MIKIVVAATLTLSVPGRHGDDPVDSSFSHGADHGAHWLGVSRHGIEHGGWEAETGHDHILPFEMSLQAARRENVCFHHLEAADGKQFCMQPSMIHLTPEIKLCITCFSHVISLSEDCFKSISPQFDHSSKCRRMYWCTDLDDSWPWMVRHFIFLWSAFLMDLNYLFNKRCRWSPPVEADSLCNSTQGFN